MRRRGKVIRFPGSPEPLPPPARRPESAKPAFVEVYRCGRSEALVVRGLLESDGIPTVLRSRLAHSVHPFSVGGQGEVVILVPEPEAARSRQLLARMA